MTAGHARSKHGGELGASAPNEFRAQLRTHLAQADRAFAVTDDRGRRRYLLTDSRTDRVAWIVPHKEHRWTLFSPRQGVEAYARKQALAVAPHRWRSLDMFGPQARAGGRIASSDRGRQRGGIDR